MDTTATFTTYKIDLPDDVSIFYSRRYSKYESNKEQRISNDLNEVIEQKDTKVQVEESQLLPK